jgi:hypothetical protein
VASKLIDIPCRSAVWIEDIEGFSHLRRFYTSQLALNGSCFEYSQGFEDPHTMKNKPALDVFEALKRSPAGKPFSNYKINNKPVYYYEIS